MIGLKGRSRVGARMYVVHTERLKTIRILRKLCILLFRVENPFSNVFWPVPARFLALPSRFNSGPCHP